MYFSLTTVRLLGGYGYPVDHAGRDFALEDYLLCEEKWFRRKSIVRVSGICTSKYTRQGRLKGGAFKLTKYGCSWNKNINVLLPSLYNMTKIGAIIIHSSSYTNRAKYVDRLKTFFADTEVECKVIDGVITDRILYDARFEENRALTKGQIGCAIAHTNALKTALDMDVDYAFIFEDDVVCHDSYTQVKKWLDNLPPDYELCLIMNVGSYQGIGHDGRIHTNTVIDDIQYVTCPYGTQAYFANKQTIQLLYETQINCIEQSKIYIADSLFIHCEKKESKEFLKIVTPVKTSRFFTSGYEPSIIENIR